MHIIDFKIWSASILLAMFVHGMFFMQTGDLSGMKLPIVESLSTTRLTFKQMQNKVPDNKIITAEKNVPKTESATIPVVQKKSKTMAEKKDPVKKKPEPVFSAANTSTSAEKQLIDMTPVVDKSWLKKKRDIYFMQLMGHIEKYKFYPGSARRRGITGKVSISFHLNNDGGISNLHIVSQHKILKQAAAQALDSALPMPLPEKDILNTREIKFNMLYAMQ